MEKEGERKTDRTREGEREREREREREGYGKGCRSVAGNPMSDQRGTDNPAMARSGGAGLMVQGGQSRPPRSDCVPAAAAGPEPAT